MDPDDAAPPSSAPSTIPAPPPSVPMPRWSLSDLAADELDDE
jgi:hypothetical protein